MNSLSLNIWGNSSLETNILSTPGKLVDTNNLNIASLMKTELEKTFLNKFFNYPVFGLSACQIARNEEEALQLFLLHENGVTKFLANPKIIKASEIKVVGRMYCCSTSGGERVLIASPFSIVLEFLNICSGEVNQTIFNYPSTASIIHELSHLEGKNIEVDMLPGTKCCKGKMLENLDDNEKTKILLGDHFLAEHYVGGNIIVVSSKECDTFILDDGKKYCLEK